MERVCIVGSGNWGSAIAAIAGRNALTEGNIFHPEVRMWVYEEMVEGRKLTDIINQDHENVKYLPGVKLPPNVVAVPELAEAARDATMLVFVLPHQFLGRLFPIIKANMDPNARGISLIKGIEFENGEVVLISDMIRNALTIDMCVLMGANVANEVARGDFCETTIGYRDKANGLAFKQLFNTPKFHVSAVADVAGVEMCGALKNVVALAAGICDGLGYGGNTKAALIRIGLLEMRRFVLLFFAECGTDTLLESCGVADLITTCYGGRNRKCAEAFVRSGQSWEELEKEMLNGQKLQGTITSRDVQTVIDSKGLRGQFPLFERVYRICFLGEPATTITDLPAEPRL